MNPQLNLRAMRLVSLALCSLFFANCASGPPKANPNQTGAYEAVHVNPYPPGTYAHFKASANYPKTYSIYRDEALLAATSPSNSEVIIDRDLQRGLLLNNGKVAMDYPVSTGKGAFPTPSGSFTILEKKRDGKRSNLYGKIYDAEGNVVNSDADSTSDTIPEGGKFVGASMPYWMRITWTGVGMHQGRVPRYPASHGCIRTYYKAVSTVYSKVDKGTPVVVR
ncbi:L,D-transpeptidase [Rubritalea spongiae]|uniref:L,D-transpeptidase n=1 Tax=Rubritalea spongiae TaxID=430797 RepID=A0ABW5E7R2_9BACT